MPSLPNIGDTGWGTTLNDYISALNTTVGTNGSTLASLNTYVSGLTIAGETFTPSGSSASMSAATLQTGLNTVTSTGTPWLSPYNVVGTLSGSNDLHSDTSTLNTRILGGTQAIATTSGTIDLSGYSTPNQIFTITQNSAITFDATGGHMPGVSDGSQIMVILTQGAASVATPTFTGIKKPTAPQTLATSTTNGAIDILVFWKSGAQWYVALSGLAFS